ncbi:MAG: AAA family ATPase [Desulfuromonadales bacterium]|nr:AAA family ATPase [Desulfuromonadales bacterium]
MIISRIELRHFGRFVDAAFDFTAGINLVTGPNETGKSTIMAAIPAVLYGLRDKERYRPWGREGGCSATLVLQTAKGTIVRIEREIISDRVTLTETDPQGAVLLSFEGKIAPLGRSSERALYLEHLERITGHADEEIFRASLFFAQGSLEIDAPGEIASRIKTLLSGCAEVDYDQVLESLHEDYFAITRENPWGKDKAKDRELEEVRNRLKELESLWNSGRGHFAEEERLQQKIVAVREELTGKRAQLAEGKRYLEWVRRQWQFEEKEVSLQKDYFRVQKVAGKVEDLQEELLELQKNLTYTGLPVEIPDALPQLLTGAEVIRKDLITLQEEMTRLRRERSLLGEAPWLPAVILSALVLIGFVLFGKGSTSYLALGGLISVFIWGFFIFRLMRLNATRAALGGQLDQVTQRRSEVLASLTEIEEAVRRLGFPASAVEMVKMEKSLDRHRSLVLRIKEIESALQVLDHPEAISGEEKTLSRKMAVLAERKEMGRPPRAEILRPEDLPEAERKLSNLETEVAAHEEIFLELTRQQAEVRGAGGIDPCRIDEERAVLCEREISLLRRKESLALAYELLRGAVDDFRHTYIDRFSGEIGHSLAFITRNRYQAVRLDENFNPLVQVRDELWQSVDRLSRGAQDAVFFAVRLALTRHLTRSRHLPLLLDDPFVHLDKGRLSEMLKLLERVSQEHQLLLFSHSETLLHRAEKNGWSILSLMELPVNRSLAASTNKTKEKEKSADDTNQLSLL